MDKTIYRREFKVLSPDSSQDKLLKPSCAMKYFQEMSDCHSREVGNGEEELRERNMALISVRTSLTFHRTPRWQETFLCETWHREMKGTKWVRDCVMKSMDGELLVESTTGWVLMDLTERRVLRPTKVPGLTILTAPELALPSARMDRMQIPEDLPVVGHYDVHYTDIDYFGHLNNCVYADFILDFLPTPINGREVTKLDISFIDEAHQGDTLELRAAEIDGVTYFEGCHERGRCFQAIVESRPIR